MFYRIVMSGVLLLTLVFGVSNINAASVLKPKASEMSPVLKVGNKAGKSKIIKFKIKGRAKQMRRTLMRLRNPAVFRLLKKTERVATSYKARGKGGVPLDCGSKPGFLACWHGDYLCWVSIGKGGVSAGCSDQRNSLWPW